MLLDYPGSEIVGDPRRGLGAGRRAGLVRSVDTDRCSRG